MFKNTYFEEHLRTATSDGKIVGRLIVSATRRRRDIKIPALCLSATTMNARTSAIFPFSTGSTLVGQIWSKKKKKIKTVSLS